VVAAPGIPAVDGERDGAARARWAGGRRAARVRTPPHTFRARARLSRARLAHKLRCRIAQKRKVSPEALASPVPCGQEGSLAVPGSQQLVAGRFQPGHDRMFDPGEFLKVQKAIGKPFTLDGASLSDGSNSLVTDNYCHAPGRPFQQENLRGHHVFLNAPFEQLQEFLQHYREQKARYPSEISGCFVVPNWKTASFQSLLKGMSVVKQYSKGTRLFWAVDATTGKRELMPGTPWGVTVWYDPPRMTRQAVRAKLRLVRRVCFEDEVPEVCLDLEPDCSMVTTGHLAGHKCQIMFDSGATSSFVSKKLAMRLGLQLQSAAVEVIAFDGRALQSDGVVSARLRVQGLHERVSLRVVEMEDSYDVILGNNWLNAHLAKLDYEHRCVSVLLRDKRYTLRAQQAGSLMEPCAPTRPSLRSGPHFLSAAQVKRHMRKRARMWLVHVRQKSADTADVDQVPALPQSAPSVRGQGCVPKEQLDAVLAEFSDVFQDLPPGLPPERAVSHTIPLKEGNHPPWRPLFRLSPAERAEVEQQVKHLLEMGYVTPSTSPFGAPILFVPKPDGSLRMCVDFRALNSITVKNRYALPRVDDLLDSLHGATVFSAIDLASGYWQIRLGKDEAHKTAFRTHFGHYEWKVLPFGLCNAPATFQAMMNDIFRDHGLNRFVAVYLDDILVYSRTPEEHVEHLRRVLQVLRDNKFFAKPAKCHFNKNELKYLGHIVGAEGIKVDPAKVAAVSDWPVPTSPGDVRSFLGLATYFRRFIQGFSTLARPLHQLTSKAAAIGPWQWDDACQAAFDGLKAALCTAPVLAMPNMDRPFEIVSDASVHGTGAVLMQDGRPVAYESKKFSGAEYNYDTGEQELLGVIHALKAFRCYVEGNEFRLVTDHQPLTYLKTQPRLSRKHARWYEFLQTFDFQWEHRAGHMNVADPLSRVGQRDAHAAGGIRYSKTRNRIFRSPPAEYGIPEPRIGYSQAPQRHRLAAVTVDDHSSLLSRVLAGYAKDPWFADVAAKAAQFQLTQERDFWWRGDALVVPDYDGLRADVLRVCHDSPIGGHFGVSKTLDLLKRSYWWPTSAGGSMYGDCKKHVSECSTCQRTKQSNRSPQGELSPLPVPDELWEVISLDFIVKLPLTKSGNDCILVVVDKLSKYVVLHPCSETITAEQLITTLNSRVIGEKGYPKTVMSDRDGRCTATVFREWCEEHNIEQRLNTAYHSRANGQTERFNLTLENYLRAYVQPSLDNWDELLPVAQLAINNSYQESVQTTPYYLNHGRHPYIPGVNTLQRTGVTKGAADSPERAKWLKEKANSKAKWPVQLREAVAKAKQCLAEATDRMKRQFDKKRTPKQFEVGERVWLSTRNLKFKGVNCPKIQDRFCGPFTIEERVGSVSYKLTLPETMRVHPVFHVELLKEYKGEEFTPPPPIVCEDGTVKHEVGKILEVRGDGDQRQYLVHWEGYGPHEDSWEPRAILLEDCPVLIAQCDHEQELKDAAETQPAKKRAKPTKPHPMKRRDKPTKRGRR
jgi:hypothetical protein